MTNVMLTLHLFMPLQTAGGSPRKQHAISDANLQQFYLIAILIMVLVGSHVFMATFEL